MSLMLFTLMIISYNALASEKNLEESKQLEKISAKVKKCPIWSDDFLKENNIRTWRDLYENDKFTYKDQTWKRVDATFKLHSSEVDTHSAFSFGPEVKRTNPRYTDYIFLPFKVEYENKISLKIDIPELETFKSLMNRKNKTKFSISEKEYENQTVICSYDIGYNGSSGLIRSTYVLEKAVKLSAPDPNKNFHKFDKFADLFMKTQDEK